MSRKSEILSTDLDRKAFAYYDNKRNDPINLALGDLDGLYHHHFAVGDFDRTILELPDDQRDTAINEAIHAMETDQVELLTTALEPLTSTARVLDAGSGRGGTAFMLHRRFGCRVDGVNTSAYQIDFARTEAQRHGLDQVVSFHRRNMNDTGFPEETFDAIVTNETTMYVDPYTAFREFSRVLKPGGTYVLVSWCNNDTVAPHPTAEAMAIDENYHCHTHRRSTYLAALLNAGLVPYRVDDLTADAIPYWELRSWSTLATGVEEPYLTGYRNDHVNYLRIISHKRADYQPVPAVESATNAE
ncbi:class I SAM-dependent methyltransferase [Nocardia panacis]|uniref:Class I SAM-dependent methyltransferase n=1 Tax=Nocardia panacis TaxID=2340916 RepID=A0A3A4JNT9_9NOCA|nr:class I SAM-dependent methyltransferase [Nocardia panacis]RJO70638.1 class I SAM-dependent methyltransferase [Nocardia panacis]